MFIFKNKRDSKHCVKHIKYDFQYLIKIRKFNNKQEFNFGSDWTFFSSLRHANRCFQGPFYN